MRWFHAVGLVLLLAALAIAALPLSWVTARYVPGLEADAVSGSIWNGRLVNARYAGLAIGDVEAGLRASALLSGKAELGFERLGERLSGRVGVGRGLRSVSGLEGTLTLPLAGRQPALPLALTLGFRDAFLEADARGRCRAAGGEVTAELGGLPVIGSSPMLTGTPACAGELLLLPLAAPGGAAGLDLRVAPDGAWSADLALSVRDPLVAALLGTVGFAADGDRLTLRLAG
jgi:general secretion pathway protein N